MVGERIAEGLVVRFRPQGVARFFPAAFLAFWLCGWAVGECLAIGFLAKGVLALMNGTPFEQGQGALPLGAAIAMGAFLIFWLSLWTLGGFGAMCELLRLLWSEDKIIANRGGLTLARSLGPFRIRREFPHDEIRQVLLAPRNCALGVETTRGRFELSRSGTREEREEAIGVLRTELGLSDAAPESEPVRLPKGWQQIITPEGERALVADIATRRNQARLVAVLGVGMVGVALLALAQLQHGFSALPGALIATLTALGLASGAAWLSRGRIEWRMGNGRVTQRRRFGSKVTDLFEAVRLELVMTTDSDNDDCYALEAVNDVAEPQPASGQWKRLQSKNRRRIAAALRDPVVPRQLGAWLAREANVPIQDRTTPAARKVDMKQVRLQLEKAGPLGRIAARFIVDAQEKRSKSA